MDKRGGASIGNDRQRQDDNYSWYQMRLVLSQTDGMLNCGFLRKTQKPPCKICVLVIRRLVL